MPSGSEGEWLADAVIHISLWLIAAVLAFIVVRRVANRFRFQRRDRLAVWVKANWDAILDGRIAPSLWTPNHTVRKLVQEALEARRQSASGADCARLRAFARESGLADLHRRRLRSRWRWKRRGAIQELGLLGVSEAIPEIALALEDSDPETAADAVRALGRMEIPAAGDLLIERLRRPIPCSLKVLETALFQTLRSDPARLLAAIFHATPAERPLLARVLAAIVPRGFRGDTAFLAADTNPEVRACAARLLGAAQLPESIPVLGRLAADAEWIVRLRATVALGEFASPDAIAPLVGALCDRNRLVRMRAGASLARIEGEEVRVLRLVLETGDRYALQSLVTELDRAGRLMQTAASLGHAGREAKEVLQALQRAGAVHALNKAAQDGVKICIEPTMRQLAQSLERESAGTAPAQGTVA